MRTPPTESERSDAPADLQLTRVDVSDAAGFAEFHRVLTTADAAGRAYAIQTRLDEMRVGFEPDNTEFGAQAVVAHVRGDVVGAMSLELPYRDNTGLVEAQVAVLPEWRRRGVGSALFERALSVARAAQRSSIVAEVAEPVGGEAPGTAFAEACGMTRRNVELHQILDLPVADGVLAELGAQAARAESDGYRVVVWRDRCPDEYVAGYCALQSVFMDHVPLGELEVESQRWDVDRLRATERRRREQGRTAYRSLALSPDGYAVGFSDMLATAPLSTDVRQGSLLVLPEHRGHRLGIAMKLANLRAVQRHQPERRTLHTYNAPSNEPVLATNERFGFRPVEQNSEWQRPV